VSDNRKKPEAPSLTLQLWRQFSSMKFAIILLIVIAVVSVLSMFIGEFYPVKASAPGWEEFWQKELGISPPLFSFLTFLKLHDPYHSKWYLLLLLLLVISLLACIIDRLPGVIKTMQWGGMRGSDEISKMGLSKSFNAAGPAADVAKRLPKGFRYQRTQEDGELRIIGKRANSGSYRIAGLDGRRRGGSGAGIRHARGGRTGRHRHRSSL